MIPELTTIRTRLASSAVVTVTQLEDSSSRASVAITKATSHRDIRSVLSFDGDHAQVVATSAARLLSLCDAENIEFVKWAAAASMIQQPADVGRMHTSLHVFFKSADGEAYKGPGRPSSQMRLFLQQFEQCSIPAASRKVFAHFLSHIEVAINKAFNMSSIIKAWTKAGYFPLDIDLVMATGEVSQKTRPRSSSSTIRKSANFIEYFKNYTISYRMMTADVV